MGKSATKGPSLGSKIKSGVGNLKKYWNKPPAGRYLSFKEAVAYCVGGMGAVGATVVPVYVTLAAGVYIAAALKINVDDIVLVGIITSIITILRSPLYSLIIDNTHTKYGKFRPYLIWTPIPIVLTFFAFGFLDMIPNYTWMLVAFIVLFNVMQFFMGLYGLAFNTLLQVISPKQSEKEWLMGLGSFVYSLGPSVVNFIIPLVANLLFTIKDANGEVLAMGVNTIMPFKWFIPLILIICFALGYWTAFGTKERIVQPKEHKQKIGFFHGVASTSKNEYFWLSTAGGVLSVFKLMGSTYVIWLCNYAIMTEWAQPVFTTIISTAYTPGMLLAPLLISKFGKKNLTIFSNLACVIMTVPMVFACISPIPATPYIIIALSYLIILVNAVQVVTTPAIQTQVYDYQQYKTGERLEGFISQYGAIITTLVGMGTAFVQPAIFKHFGFVDDPSVLQNPDILYPIIGSTCIIAIGSGILGTIPFFFWKLNEKRHACIIEILKVRALRDEAKFTQEVADSIEQELENGNVEALSRYIIDNNIEGLDEFISIKQDKPEDAVESDETGETDSVETVDDANSTIESVDGENNDIDTTDNKVEDTIVSEENVNDTKSDDEEI